MKLTYKFQLKKNKILDKFSLTSKNLYNQANYILRNKYFEYNEKPNYYELEKIMKTMKTLEGEFNYSLLPAQTSQQNLMLLVKNWKGYFASIKDYYKNPNKYLGKPKIPNYIRKQQNILIFTNQTCKIKNNRIVNKKYNINIRIPKYKDFTKFQQIRIIPKKEYYEIEIVYEEEIKNHNLDNKKLLSIDLGVNNFLTCTENNIYRKPFIINGCGLKSINQYYNKQIGKLSRIRTNGRNPENKKDYSYFERTKRMNRITDYRNNYIKDKMHLCGSFIIKYCLKNKIGRICVGELTGMKNNSKVSKKNNQQIQQLPIQNFKQYLKYKCEINRIEYLEVDESYTSKCSALDLESIEKHKEYVGKRIYRGLFSSSKGLINADINGSLNIMRKVLGDKDFTPLADSRIWYNPEKIREINPNSFEQFLLSFDNNVIQC